MDEMENFLIGKLFDLLEDGENKSCDVEFRANGELMSCGIEGTWKLVDSRIVEGSFDWGSD